MARPKKNVNGEQVVKLAALGCSLKEIGAFFDVHEDTISNRFSAEVSKGREEGRTRLRRLQWKSAEAGNVTMQIWLGKQILGQRDGTLIEMPTGKRLIIEDSE